VCEAHSFGSFPELRGNGKKEINKGFQPHLQLLIAGAKVTEKVHCFIKDLQDGFSGLEVGGLVTLLVILSHQFLKGIQGAAEYVVILGD
jgi:hypothetical protein